MALLKSLETGHGFLKAGLRGFEKSGKTTTGLFLAIAAKRVLGHKGPIVFLDTEQGSPFAARILRELCDEELVGMRTRIFDEIVKGCREAEQAGAACVVVDSMTHLWEEVKDSYLAQLNRKRSKKIPKLQFQHWADVKRRFQVFKSWFLNSACHVVICGRSGFTYDFLEMEEGGQKELVKTGVRMKSEGELGYEPSLIVDMQRIEPRDGSRISRKAVVLGDRFGVVDGKEKTFETIPFTTKKNIQKAYAAVENFFLPHLRLLKPGGLPVIEEGESDMGIGENGMSEYRQEKTDTTILLEEIQGLLVSAHPGQSAREKKVKTDLVQQVFGTRSWTKVELLGREHLRAGLDRLRELLEPDRQDMIARWTALAKVVAEAGRHHVDSLPVDADMTTIALRCRELEALLPADPEPPNGPGKGARGPQEPPAKEAAPKVSTPTAYADYNLRPLRPLPPSAALGSENPPGKGAQRPQDGPREGDPAQVSDPAGDEKLAIWGECASILADLDPRPKLERGPAAMSTDELKTFRATLLEEWERQKALKRAKE
jgi:hypothetical protein